MPINNPSGGGPGIKLISEQIISAAVTSLTFSGLDGNTDGFYFLECEKDGSLSTGLNLYVNGNNTPTNYYLQYIEGSGSSIFAGILNFPRFMYNDAPYPS